MSEIENCGYFDKIHPYRSIIEVLDDTIPREFLKEIRKCSLFSLSGINTPKIVYNPLNGTGNILVREILKNV